MLLRVLYYIEEQEVYLTRRTGTALQCCTIVKVLPHGGLVRSSHAFPHLERRCGSRGTKDLLLISQMEEIGMATSKNSV